MTAKKPRRTTAKKPAASPAKRWRSAAIVIYLHPEEKAAFEAAAKADRRNLSDWIRSKLGDLTGFVLPEKP